MRGFFVTAVVRAGKCSGEITIGDDGDKDKDAKSGDGVEGKDKDDVRKSSSREGEIIDKDDEEKCEGRAAGTKSCDEVGGGDRDDVNTELSGDDIGEETLGRSGASDGDVGSWDWKVEECNEDSEDKDEDGRTYWRWVNAGCNRKVGVFGDRRSGGEDRTDENGVLDWSINFIRNQLASILN